MVISNRPHTSLLSPAPVLLLYPFLTALYNQVALPVLDPDPAPAPAGLVLVLVLAAVPSAVIAYGDSAFSPAQPCQRAVLALAVWELIVCAGDEMVACSSSPAAESFYGGWP